MNFQIEHAAVLNAAAIANTQFESLRERFQSIGERRKLECGEKIREILQA